jgi:hypothetical protein
MAPGTCLARRPPSPVGSAASEPAGDAGGRAASTRCRFTRTRFVSPIRQGTITCLLESAPWAGQTEVGVGMHGGGPGGIALTS